MGIHRSPKKEKTIYCGERGRKLKKGYDPSYGSGCYSKIRYKNRSAAENTILRDYPEEYTLLPYKCKHCGGWHIGNKRKKSRRTPRKSHGTN